MDFYSTMPTHPMESWWPYIISILVGLVTCIKGFMGGTACPASDRMDGKVIVVTGASSGIGFEISKELAARGGHIIMCCRSLQKGMEAMKLIKKKQADAKLTLKKLDLSSLTSVQEFGECLGDNKIDVLINNAGIIFHPFCKTMDGFEIHLCTNYLGHFLLTHLLIKNLKRSEQGRIINVCAGLYQPTNMPLNCEASKENYIAKEWFAQSKFALILMTKRLSKLLKETNITINAMNPGMVRGTQHLRHSVLMKNWSVRISLAPWMWLFMKSPKQGAQTAVFLATDPNIAKSSGKFYSNCSEELTIGKTNDPDAAKCLYDKTCLALNNYNIKKIKLSE